AELGRLPSESDLAERFLQLIDHPESAFPLGPDFARSWLGLWEAPSRGVLGQASEHYPGVPPSVLRDRSLGLNFPTLIGLITLTTAGVLFPGDPEQAYRATYETNFLDIGYAKEAVSLLCAAIAAAITSDSPAGAVREAIALDPYSLGGPFGGPLMREKLPGLIDRVPLGVPDEVLAEHLSRALDGMHPFDPYKTLAIAVAGVLARPTDPFRAILIAANHRAINADGSLGALLDIDCYGCVAGALAGAVAGDAAFPDRMLDQVVAANREVYGFDLEATVAKTIAIS
ncbi:MAG TPA: ADP-ribosylglycohydrolase family protein, partial [Armatimonadota bacterium]|nr:ADP-ribosylglycohydrolase family protein [Armatimonadota bacterium]